MDPIHATIVVGHTVIGTLPLSPDRPLVELQGPIQQLTSIPIAEQTLYLSTMPASPLVGHKSLLEQSPSFFDYPLADHLHPTRFDQPSADLCACKILVRGARGSVTVRVTRGAKTVYVTVKESEMCIVIKLGLIEARVVQATTTCNQMRLLFQGHELADNLPVKYYGLQTMADLRLGLAKLSTLSIPKGERPSPPLKSPPSQKTGVQSPLWVQREPPGTTPKPVKTMKKEKEEAAILQSGTAASHGCVGDIVAVDCRGTSHTFTACDYTLPIFTLRRRFPPGDTEGCCMRYAGKTIEDEHQSYLSLQPVVGTQPEKFTLHPIYFVEGMSDPPHHQKNEQVQDVSGGIEQKDVFNQTHHSESTADLIKRLHEAEQRASEYQSKYLRARERICELESALERSYDFLDRVMGE